MPTPNQLTDTRALAQHRARARPGALFLQDTAADEIEDRLGMVNRAFSAPAVVTPFPDVWASRLPGAKIVAEAEALDLEPQAHDLVVHALALHWSNDPVGQLIQCRRALKPDGLLLAAALGGTTLQELRRCLGEAEIAMTGGLSPRVAPMGEIRDLGALLQRAGLALPVADSVPLHVAYRDARHLMHDLRDMGEANALQSRLRRAPRRALFEAVDALYAEHFATPDGRVSATFEIVVLTGWAPHADQPQPLRPGSARTRLAEALDTSETPLRD
ncbi:methyltransferase domain-containing protein [Sulfitobacter sp. D35]|uniref:methyltransferase domain-containing protein n=1 Tax=Sulfitobacter sp. D35 TaxID=3083252 RepID=UPI00296E81B9|nr:methyltransferase domain-containing protein [Sulfitobacter sp. D35]MDW4498037.1 methyltransferase domain-containing protein [Sulfitobacter sp. D35]